MDLAGDSQEDISGYYASIVKFLRLAEVENIHVFSAWVQKIYNCFLVTWSGNKCIISEGSWPSAEPPQLFVCLLPGMGVQQ